jgi:hypothetical protein
MSVPASREPRQGGRWETIRYALDTNPRTFRLCLILLVTAVAPCLAAVVAELVRHLLLCGSRSGMPGEGGAARHRRAARRPARNRRHWQARRLADRSQAALRPCRPHGGQRAGQVIVSTLQSLLLAAGVMARAALDRDLPGKTRHLSGGRA